jgi:hypothetical protein
VSFNQRHVVGVSRAVASSGYRPVDLQFAPAINPSASLSSSITDLHRRSATPALPSNSTSDSHRLSDPSASLPINLQLAPSANLPAQPSSQPFDLRLVVNLPGPPLHRPATVAACRSSSHAFRSTSSFRLRPIFRLNLPVNLRLASPVSLPALPSNLTSDSHRLLCPLALLSG